MDVALNVLVQAFRVPTMSVLGVVVSITMINTAITMTDMASFYKVLF